MTSGLDMCLRNGLTAVHSIEDMWPECKTLSEENLLPIRVFYSALNESAPYSAGFPRPEETHGLLSCDRVKIFADGGLGGATAALSVPYKGQSQCGLLLHKKVGISR